MCVCVCVCFVVVVVFFCCFFFCCFFCECSISMFLLRPGSFFFYLFVCSVLQNIAWTMVITVTAVRTFCLHFFRMINRRSVWSTGVNAV